MNNRESVNAGMRGLSSGLRTVLVACMWLSLAAVGEEWSPWLCDHPAYVPGGRWGTVQKFDFWRSRVFLKTPGVLNRRAGTLQFYAQLLRSTEDMGYWSTLVAGGARKAGGGVLGFGATIVPPWLGDGKNARLAIGGGGKSVSVPLLWQVGEWHALAITWDREAIAVYMDGALIGKQALSLQDELLEDPEYLSFGGGTCKRYGNNADCLLDKIELSDCVRSDEYIQAFAAAKQAPVPDEHTSALYHFDGVSAPYWRMTETFRRDMTPYAVWRSGFFDNYGTFAFGQWPELPFTLVNSGADSCRFVVSVEVYDAAGDKVAENSEAFEAAAVAVVQKTLGLSLQQPGWYSYTMNIEVAGRRLLAEKHSFVILPEIPPSARSRDNLWGNHLYGTRKADFFTQAGIPWERDMRSFLWHQVEPSHGEWDWRAPDLAVKEAKAHGMFLVGILGHPAKWAGKDDVSHWPNPDKVSPRSRPPRDLQEFSDYVQRTVSRYQDDVKYWEIWNEPDWNTPGGPCAFAGSDAEYLAVLEAGYLAAKKADPTCDVLSGGFVPLPHQIDYLHRHGGFMYFDILGMHRYRPWATLAKFASLSDKPAWQSEHLVSHPEEVITDLLGTLNNGFQKCFLQDAPTSSMTHFNVGGFDAHGWEPQPVYFAMALAAAKTGGKSYSGRVHVDELSKLLEVHVFDRDLASQTILIVSPSVGSYRLEMSCMPMKDGLVVATALTGKEQRLQGRAGDSITVVVDGVLFLEGAVVPETLHVALFKVANLIQNSDFRALEGDFGTDELARMRPVSWHFEPEAGSIAMTKTDDGHYAITLDNAGSERPVRVIQKLFLPEAGFYTVSVDFYRSSSDVPLPYLTIHGHPDKPTGLFEKIPSASWQTYSLTFAVDTPQTLALVAGLSHARPGVVLLRNPRLVKSVDPALLATTTFYPLPDSIEEDSLLLRERNVDVAGFPVGLRQYGHALYQRKDMVLDYLVIPENQARTVPVAGQSATFNFLFSAMYVKAQAGETIGECVVEYADGSSTTLSFARGRDIDDWYPPMIGADLEPADTAMTDGGIRAIFSTTMANPYPQKKLKALTFKNSGNALWIVFAASGRKLGETSP